MKSAKLIIFFIVSIISLSANCQTAQGSTTEVNLKAHAGVAQVFKVSFEPTSLDFGSLKAGTRLYNLPKGGFKINCKSNVEGPWTLKVSASSFSDGQKKIAPENTRWYGFSTLGKGQLTTGQTNFSETPAVLYQSSEAEGNNLPKGTDIDLRFALDIPFEQEPGDYHASLQFTLTQ